MVLQKPFKVASVQFNPKLDERDGNIIALLKAVEEAADNGAKLIVTPEMATTGYHYHSREAIQPFVDTIPGCTTDQFAALCRKKNVYVVVGMPEVDAVTGLFYNSAALIGPTGWIGTYRKVHLWELEAHWAVPGDLGIPVFPTELGKIAINICMDSIFFESARLAALKGADILTFPTNSTAQSISLLQARAESNGLYVISANRSNTECGYHMIGASAVWSPAGEKLAESVFVPSPEDDIHEPSILYAEIDPAQYQNKAKDRMDERRPSMYKELMLYISPWDYSQKSSPRELTVAAIQYEPVPMGMSENLEKARRLIQTAAAHAAAGTAKLCVLPELSLTGPVSLLEPQERMRLAEPADGPTSQVMRELARRYKTAIIYGFLEENDGRLYNSCALISSEGLIEGVYRQVHLRQEDKQWAAPGERISVISSAELGRVGMMIGYDALFPETAGVLAVGRADLIAIPASFVQDDGKEIAINPSISANPYPEGAIAILDAIAIGSQAYTVVANFTGTQHRFTGRSGMYTLDPLYGLDQPVIGSADREEAVLATCTTIQANWWFQQEKLIAARRTAVYKPLVFNNARM
ncbi:MAG: nitrilase [Brevibacillus sp.]|nr:nitrilase [Brevibacillus sp.]